MVLFEGIFVVFVYLVGKEYFVVVGGRLLAFIKGDVGGSRFDEIKDFFFLLTRGYW